MKILILLSLISVVYSSSPASNGFSRWEKFWKNAEEEDVSNFAVKLVEGVSDILLDVFQITALSESVSQLLGNPTGRLNIDHALEEWEEWNEANNKTYSNPLEEKLNKALHFTASIKWRLPEEFSDYYEDQTYSMDELWENVWKNAEDQDISKFAVKFLEGVTDFLLEGSLLTSLSDGVSQLLGNPSGGVFSTDQALEQWDEWNVVNNKTYRHPLQEKMEKTYYFTFSAMFLSHLPESFNKYSEEFTSWKSTHNKTYSQMMEEKLRMIIFAFNSFRIELHNILASFGEKSFEMKMNEFGDELMAEVAEVRNGYRKGLLNIKKNKNAGAATFIIPENVRIPEAVDWRTKGAVTEVKNQGQCGSCWAFSATGSLEGQNYRKTGKLVSLSEQNLIDCSYKFGNQGCQGGLMDSAFQYVKENHGIDTEDSYPYKADNEKCHFSQNNIGASDVGYVDIPEGDEATLMKAVATMGPISIAIDASKESFQFYSKGIYDEPACSSKDLDHGVLIVGYGTEKGQDYWLVKNSWGNTWGDNGYIKMARNKRNQCGVATAASYPLV